MPNTTNYSFPTPADTDLVKNGADAIRDLGDAVDTAMNTALGTKKAGMVLLNTTSFSAVASVSLAAATFSATYANYKIYISGTIATGVAGITARMRVGGSDNSTASSYVGQRLALDNTTVAGSRVTDTNWDLGGFDTTLVNALEIDLINPFAASATGMFFRTSRSTSGAYFHIGSGTHNQTVSYDSFTFYSSNNLTGTVSVYGYNK